jgi:hypothetical protein
MATSFTSTLVHAGGFMVSESNQFRSRAGIIVLSGEVLVAGHVLGKIMVGGTAVAALNAGVTGNPTFATVTAGAAAKVGRYRLTFLTATTFNVEDPDGNLVGNGTLGVAFLAGGIGFTATAGGTPAVAGDSATITVTAGTDKYREYNPANTDGSNVPAGIIWDKCDATGADKRAAAVVREAEVNAQELTWFSGASAGQKTAALQSMADRLQIIGRPAI